MYFTKTIKNIYAVDQGDNDLYGAMGNKVQI